VYKRTEGIEENANNIRGKKDGKHKKSFKKVLFEAGNGVLPDVIHVVRYTRSGCYG
jgi:hypothetical protein